MPTPSQEPEKPIRKQLIVVVHGVGIRSAGESSDLVAGALDGATTQVTTPATGQGAEGQATPEFRRRSSDDFLLFETVPGDDSRIARSYPARLTRFRKYTGQFPDPDSPERVISDVYWGDVGGFASSVPAVIVGLGRIMLGLAHVVRENALTVFPTDKDNWWKAGWRALARGAALAIHGPVFALNITLLIGLGFIILLGDKTNWVSVGTAGTALALAWWLQTRSRSFLLRHMGAYLALFALVLLSFVALDRFAPTSPPEEVAGADPSLKYTPRDILGKLARNEPLVQPTAQAGPDAFVIPWVDATFRAALCSWKNGNRIQSDGVTTLELVRNEKTDRQVCMTMHQSGPFLHAMRLQGLMVMIWFGIAGVTLVFGLRWLLAVALRNPRHRRDVLMPTLSLMTLLWFLLIGLGWAAVAAAYTQIGPGPIWDKTSNPHPTCGIFAIAGGLCDAGADHTKLFTTSLRGIWAAGATLAVLILVGAVVFFYRRTVLRGMTPGSYMADANQNAEKARLVVPPVLFLALGTMPFSILLLIFASKYYPPDYCDVGTADKLVCWLEANTTSVLTWIVAVVTGGLPLILGPLRLGINVAGDVIIYLNDFHWRRTPVAEPTRTFAELVPAIARRRRRLLDRSEGYFFRKRIQRRLQNLVDDLVGTEEPDRIDFVCHSQGTVITLNVLDEKGETWGRDRELTLITMGSPWRHLYHHYFEATFRDRTEPPPKVRRWTNIFRIDDFIGTHVRSRSDDEKPIGLGGHTNYWRDSEVRTILHERLGNGS